MANLSTVIVYLLVVCMSTYLDGFKIDFGAPAAHEQFVDLMERPRPELGVVSVIAG